MRRVALWLAVVPVCAALGLPAVAPAKPRVRKGPSGLAFYKAPKLAKGHAHGGLIWARKLTGAAALPHARNELLLYRSIGVRGRPVAVSGTVAVPRGPAPKGGWPVITYAHGSTGVADLCAPTRDSATNPAHAYIAYVNPELEQWLRDGYAVARTDYEGLGTPGAHPYLIGRSEGRSTLDIVTAARRFAPTLSRRVIIAGHSQGGHAALWAAALAPRWAPGLAIRGTVAYAPASHLSEQATSLATAGAGAESLSALTAIIVRGIDTAFPGAHVGGELSARGRALYPQTLHRCLPQLGRPGSFGSLAPKDIFKPDLDVPALARLVDRSDPENLHIAGRVLVEQGLADTTVFPNLTTATVQALRKRGTPVRYRTYDGVNHAGVVSAAAADASAWIAGRLKR